MLREGKKETVRDRERERETNRNRKREKERHLELAKIGSKISENIYRLREI